MNLLHRILAWGAFWLALTSLFVDEIKRSSETVANNQVDVFELAEWIKRDDVVLTDLRGSAQIEEFRLPGALNLSDTLQYLETAGQPRKVVVYGYEDHATWRALAAGGHEVGFLADGVGQWLTQILNPVIYRFASPRELVAFEEHAEISRYFGGIPRYSNEPVEAASIADQISRVRRGCGF